MEPTERPAAAMNTDDVRGLDDELGNNSLNLVSQDDIKFQAERKVAVMSELIKTILGSDKCNERRAAAAGDNIHRGGSNINVCAPLHTLLFSYFVRRS